MQLRYNHNRRCVLLLGTHPNNNDLVIALGITHDDTIDLMFMHEKIFYRNYTAAVVEPPNSIDHAAKVWHNSTLPKTFAALAVLEGILKEEPTETLLSKSINLTEGENIMTTETNATATAPKTSKKKAGKRSTKDMKNAKKASLKKKAGKKGAAPKKAAAKKTGVCAMVHEIANAMYKKNKDVTRAEVIGACVKKGINRSTAATQYQKWMTENFA